jgi:hypothetical protein
VKLEEDKEKIQKEKDQLLAVKTVVREAVTRALHSMVDLAQMEEEPIKNQVGKLTEAIQQASSKSSRDRNPSSVEHSTRSVRSEGRNCQERSRNNQGVGLIM